MLYAVRESVLVWPCLEGNSIRLGWLADCGYGVAGAFAIFLVVPGLSESAGDGFNEIFANNSMGATSNKMDVIEVIAVGLVGGFAGRFVMRQAHENMLPHQSRDQMDGQEAEDPVALEVARRIVFPNRESPDREEIVQAIERSSPEMKREVCRFLEDCYVSNNGSFPQPGRDVNDLLDVIAEHRAGSGPILSKP